MQPQKVSHVQLVHLIDSHRFLNITRRLRNKENDRMLDGVGLQFVTSRVVRVTWICLGQQSEREEQKRGAAMDD